MFSQKLWSSSSTVPSRWIILAHTACCRIQMRVPWRLWKLAMGTASSHSISSCQYLKPPHQGLDSIQPQQKMLVEKNVSHLFLPPAEKMVLRNGRSVWLKSHATWTAVLKRKNYACGLILWHDREKKVSFHLARQMVPWYNCAIPLLLVNRTESGIHVIMEQFPIGGWENLGGK